MEQSFLSTLSITVTRSESKGTAIKCGWINLIKHFRFFWLTCICISWITSVFLIRASLGDMTYNPITVSCCKLIISNNCLLESFQNNAISFVVESSYRDWNTNFPTIIVCETKNPDKVQIVAER